MIVIFEGNVRFTVHTNIYRYRSKITQGLGIVRTGFITKVDCFLFFIKGYNSNMQHIEVAKTGKNE